VGLRAIIPKAIGRSLLAGRTTPAANGVRAGALIGRERASDGIFPCRGGSRQARLGMIFP